MAKGLDENRLVVILYEWLEAGVEAGFDVDEVLAEIIDCASIAREDYEHDHSELV